MLHKISRFGFTFTPMVVTWYLILWGRDLHDLVVGVAVGSFVSHLMFLETEINKLQKQIGLLD